jgi:hypothetical protein
VEILTGTGMENKEVHPAATRGESQRLALPVSRSTYVIEEQQVEFGIGAPAFFYLFFFSVIVMAITRNFLLTGVMVGIQGFIFRNLLKDKPKNFVPHLLGYPFMQKHYVHRCKTKVGLTSRVGEGGSGV